MLPSKIGKWAESEQACHAECLDDPHQTLLNVSTSSPLRGITKPSAEAVFLQGTQALLGSGLLEHEGEDPFKGEQLAEQAFEREGFQELLLVQDMQTAQGGIQR